MRKNISKLKNEDGSVLVIALVMLALLTTLGIMSTNTTTIDLQIAQNERIAVDHFNKAEAAALFAAQWLAEAIDAGRVLTDFSFDDDGDGNDDRKFYHNGDDTTDWTNVDEALAFFRNPANWDWDGAGQNAQSLNITDAGGNNLYPNTYYVVVYAGLTGSGGAGSAGSFTFREFNCFGLYFDNTGPDRGEVLVEIGYKKPVS